MALSPVYHKFWNLGCFVEKDCGNYFEYSMATEYEAYELRGNTVEFPHIVWVTAPKEGLDCGYRRALVKKTVAYIIVDEDDYGKPVIEKWDLKKNEKYACSNVPTPGERIFNILGE